MAARTFHSLRTATAIHLRGWLLCRAVTGVIHFLFRRRLRTTTAATPCCGRSLISEGSGIEVELLLTMGRAKIKCLPLKFAAGSGRLWVNRHDARRLHGRNHGRNYHWEFYREMNDVGTAFSRKNPYVFRNGFGSAPSPFATSEWHKLQMLQIEGKILGAIDGKILLEIDDCSHVNSGCILNYGHIAIRCMIHTSVVFRNLKLWTEKLPFTEIVWPKASGRLYSLLLT